MAHIAHLRPLGSRFVAALSHAATACLLTLVSAHGWTAGGAESYEPRGMYDAAGSEEKGPQGASQAQAFGSDAPALQSDSPVAGGTLVLASAAASGLPTAAGRTPGWFGVGMSGAATYQIRLWTPPGIGTAELALSLEYNSRAGNGVLGQGWNLAGLSAITRCNKTMAQDGAFSPVAYTTADRFCLDGQQLKLVSGNPGQAGSVYATELESFSRIVANGVAGNGPASFTVTTKNGLVYEYGTTVDSQIYAGARTSIRTWALARVRDRAQVSDGNSISIYYYNDAQSGAYTNGSWRVKSITYPKAATGQGPFYSVDFVYAARPANDMLMAYESGDVIRESNLLSSITVRDYAGGATIKSYSMSYGQGASSSRLLLQSVQECSSSSCLEPTTIAYQAGGKGWSPVTSSPFSASSKARTFAIDMNGDGRDDLLYPVGLGNNKMSWRLALATATGYSTSLDTGVSGDAYSNVPLPGRFLGNGRWQFLISSNGKWVLVDYNGSGFQTVQTTIPTKGQVAADFDGDGLEDLAHFYSQPMGPNFAVCWVSVSRNATNPAAGASGIAFAAWSIRWQDPTYQCGSFGYVRPVDMNSDGRVDLVATVTQTIMDVFGNPIVIGTYHRPLISNGTEVDFTPGETIDNDEGFGTAGDWNADGCTDFISPVRVLVSDCAGGFNPIALSLVSRVSNSATLIADWDGDGRSDLLYVSSAGGSNPYKWYVVRSTGDGYATPVNTGTAASTSSTWFVFDADGDGNPDLGFRDDANGGRLKYHLHTSPGVAADLATGFVDGFGMSQSPSYASIAISNYTKETGAVFPEVDFKGALYVVSQAVLSDGIGGTYTDSFDYFGARLHLQGRGFEGFRVRRMKDSRDGTYTYDYAKQQFPYTGMLYQRTRLQDPAYPNSKLGESAAQFDVKTLGGAGPEQRVFTFIASSTEYGYELGASLQNVLVSESTSTYAYGDSYGNPTSIVETTTDKDSTSPFNGAIWRTTVTASYVNDAANNCLGLPNTISTTRAAPGQAAVTQSTSYSVDAQHCRVWQQIDEPTVPASKVATTLDFDTCGNVSSIAIVGSKPDGTSMQERRSTFDYGARCQLPETLRNPLNQATSIAYRYDFGVMAATTDPNDLTTSWVYDDFGRLTSETRPDQSTTAWAYESCRTGPCWGQNDLRFHVYETSKGSDGAIFDQRERLFDGFDRLRSMQYMRSLGAWVSESRQYDSKGRLIRLDRPTSGASNGYQAFEYDALDRIKTDRLYQANGTLDRTTGTSYSGRTTTTTDPLGRAHREVSDVMGRLRRVIDPSPGGTTWYEYDSLGNLNRIVDAIGAVSTGTYNVRGFRTQWSDSDRGSWSFKPNALGELAEWTDARGQSFSATYDLLGRRTSRTEAEGTSTWVWGASPAAHNVGRLESRSGYGYVESLSYDTRGRLANRKINVDQQDYSYDYAYNAFSAIDSLTYPTSPTPVGGTAARFRIKYGYSYGAVSSVSDITDATMVLWTLTAANDYGSPTGEMLGNGATLATGYKPWTNEPTSKQAGLAPSTSNRQNLAYQWDTVGNLTQRQDVAQSLTEVFTPDALDRVTASTLNGQPNFSAGYDASGNLTSKSGAGSYVYGDAAHPHAATAVGTHTYTYDANGNQITRDGASQAWASYNLPLQLSQPIGGTTYLSQFSYGPDHERWKQVASYSNGSETTHYIGGLLEKESPSPTGATQWRHYVYLPSGLAIIVTRAAGSAKSVRYVLTDHLGSTDRVLNEAGAVALSESFAAFGARRGSNWQDGTAPDWAGIAGTTRRGYTGHEHLDNLQLIHMNGRVYDPQAGRFLSVDPLMGDLGDSQQVNPYAYVGNRPLRATDPSGYSAADLPPFGGDPGSFLGGVFDRMNARLQDLQGIVNPYARYQMILAQASARLGQKRVSAQDGGMMCGPGQSSLACAGIGTGTLSSPASPMAEYLPVAVEVGKTLLGFVPVLGQAVAVYELVVVLRDPNSTSLDKVMAIVAVVPGGRAARGVKEGLEVIQDGRAVARVEGAVARGGGLVIGRGKDLAKPGALRAGEYKLGWPSKLPDWKGEWKENAGRLREAMRQGGPIRDVSPDDLGGPFLNAERNLLRDRGWTFDPRTNYWNPPGP